MNRHWRRESAAQRRGASKQSQVQNNSCASVAATIKPSKASLRAWHGGSTYKDDNRRSTERESNRNISINGPTSAATTRRPAEAIAKSWPPHAATPSRPDGAAAALDKSSRHGCFTGPQLQGFWPALASQMPISCHTGPPLFTNDHQRPAKASQGRPRAGHERQNPRPDVATDDQQWPAKAGQG